MYLLLYKYVLEQQEVLQVQLTKHNYDETQVEKYTATFNIKITRETTL